MTNETQTRATSLAKTDGSEPERSEDDQGSQTPTLPLDKQLPSLISTLYYRLDSEAIAPGSFSAPDWFPNASKPTGYALVLQKLDDARTAINAGELPKAERLYHEAVGVFNWCKKNLSWASRPVTGRVRWFTNWMAVISYELAWLILTLGTVQGTFGGKPDTMDLLGVPLAYLAWGAVGGIAWAIFGVWLHTIRNDFDPSYLPWYATKPLLGGIAGSLVFLSAAVIKGKVPEVNDEALYFAAFLVGFFEALLIIVLESVRTKVAATVKTMFGPSTSPTS